MSGCRDSVALWRVFGCEDVARVVVECPHFSARREIPNGGCVEVARGRGKVSRVWREVHLYASPVRKKSFVGRCVPNQHFAIGCRPCDPSAVSGCSNIPDTHRWHRRYMFAIVHSPYLNTLFTTTDEMLAVHCEYRVRQVVTILNFEVLRIFFSNTQTQHQRTH